MALKFDLELEAVIDGDSGPPPSVPLEEFIEGAQLELMENRRRLKVWGSNGCLNRRCQIIQHHSGKRKPYGRQDRTRKESPPKVRSFGC